MKRICLSLFAIFFALFMVGCNGESTDIDETDSTEVTETVNPTEIIEEINFFLIAEKDGKYGVINQNGEVILPFDYGNLSNVSLDGVMIHQKAANDFELINLQGEVLQAGFTELDAYYDHYLDHYTHMTPHVFVGVIDDLHALYDSKGEYFMSNVDYVNTYNQTVYSSRGHFRLNDVTKELMYHYARVLQYSDQAYFAFLNNQIFILDDMGDVIESFSNSTLFSSGFFLKITTDTDLFLYDFDGNRITENTHYEEAYWLHNEDYILVIEDNLQGVIDMSGEVILECIYKSIFTDNGLIIAQRNDNSYDIFHNATKLNNLTNINTTVIPGYGFDGSYVINEPGSGNAYYYRDTEIISGPYVEAYPFNRMGTAYVETTTHIKGIINDEFEVINQDYATYIPFFDYYIVEGRSGSELGKYGIVNHLGEVIVPVQYELITANMDFQYVSLGDSTNFYIHYYIVDDEGILVSLIDLDTQIAKKLYSETPNIIYYIHYISNYSVYFQLSAPNDYEIVDFIHKDFLIAIHNGKYGVLNGSYEIIIPFEYDSIFGNLPR